jgi:5-methylcytosine-specific restriction endonuclease McrBC regulatory subunit McrC
MVQFDKEKNFQKLRELINSLKRCAEKMNADAGKKKNAFAAFSKYLAYRMHSSNASRNDKYYTVDLSAMCKRTNWLGPEHTPEEYSEFLDSLHTFFSNCKVFSVVSTTREMPHTAFALQKLDMEFGEYHLNIPTLIALV